MNNPDILILGEEFDAEIVQANGPSLIRFLPEALMRTNQIRLLSELVGRLDTSKERVDPKIDSPTWVELHRSPYRFAAQYCRGRRVLDVGCSHGYGTSVLADVAETAVGFDLYPDVCADAQARYGRDNLHFLCHDANRPFPFADASFDVVFSSEVIEHVREQELCASEMARVLRPGGLLILKTPDVRSARRGNVYHFREFSRGELERLLSRHFDLVRVCYFGLKPRWACNKVKVPERPSPTTFGPPVPTESAVLIRAALRPTLMKHAEVADLFAVCQKAPVTPNEGPFLDPALSEGSVTSAGVAVA